MGKEQNWEMEMGKDQQNYSSREGSPWAHRMINKGRYDQDLYCLQSR